MKLLSSLAEIFLLFLQSGCHQEESIENRQDLKNRRESNLETNCEDQKISKNENETVLPFNNKSISMRDMDSFLNHLRAEFNEKNENEKFKDENIFSDDVSYVQTEHLGFRSETTSSSSCSSKDTNSLEIDHPFVIRYFNESTGITIK